MESKNPSTAFSICPAKGQISFAQSKWQVVFCAAKNAFCRTKPLALPGVIFSKVKNQDKHPNE